jgi:hypothetical protein
LSISPKIAENRRKSPPPWKAVLGCFAAEHLFHPRYHRGYLLVVLTVPGWEVDFFEAEIRERKDSRTSRIRAQAVFSE